jgi:eukaryotic-like serine/threonine-protein kinase
MTDHRNAFGSRRRAAWTLSTLSTAVAVGIAAAGCSGSHGTTASPPAATSSAVALASPEPASASPSSPAPSGNPASASVSASTSAGGSVPGTGAAGASSAAAPAPVGGAANAVVRTCKQQSVKRPAQFVLACGDGTTSLDSLQWANWGSATATATGVYETVVCSPSCAAGAERSYPATVSLTGLAGGAYTELSIEAPKSSPPNVHYTLGSTGPRVAQD